MTALNKQALLIENGQLVADTLRHLADNEIDSDYFAITSTNENGTEIDHELVITDYARQAAGTVDELVKALEATEKQLTSWRSLAKQNIEEHEKSVAALDTARQRMCELESKLTQNESWSLAAQKYIAELEARTVTLPPTFWYEHDDLSSDIPVLDKRLVKKAIRAAGIGVKGE
jgi:hypothetical protein